MLPWVEQAGGRDRTASTISPVVRGLFGNGSPLIVQFSPERPVGAFPEISLEASVVGEGLEAIYAALQRLAISEAMPDHDPVLIDLPELGWFYLEKQNKRPDKRLDRLICLVTGAAQGFGEGIARELAAVGAITIVADLNLPLAEAVAQSITEAAGTAVALPVDVGEENSVRQMIEQVVLRFGGLDLLVSNAGVLRAGGLEDMTLQSFDLVTRVNYTAFFLVAKYGARPMKLQARFDSTYTSDIIQINSKSGLEGSNRNFAYSGSKFGGIGLVQSIAKELVEHRIKVNAICPGNYYEGPLWSDPDKGLFVQYLRAGKVPGASTIQDIYDYYVAKVPLQRGCLPRDVVRAIFYCVEQQYETGQAIPVTGGQNMLN
jgi:NAD(P)-dependent dehydrogenase (short-subunit alcohol dehydrogenase family)